MSEEVNHRVNLSRKELNAAKRELKKLNSEIDALFKVHGNYEQFLIWDVPKIYDDCRVAFFRGDDLELAMIQAVIKYRVKH